MLNAQNLSGVEKTQNIAKIICVIKQICREKFKSFLKVCQKGRHLDAVTSDFKKDLRSAKIQDN